MSAAFYDRKPKLKNKFEPVLATKRTKVMSAQKPKMAKTGSRMQILKIADKLKDKINKKVRN